MNRLAGEYFLTFSDTVHSLAVYECLRKPDDEENPVNSGPETLDTCHREGCHSDPPGKLSDLVEEIIMTGWSDPVFRRQICRFPSPPWTPPRYANDQVIRELHCPSGDIRLISGPGTGWVVEYRSPGGNETGTIGWDPGHAKGNGEVFFSNRAGDFSRIPSPRDPYLQITHNEVNNSLFLVLNEEIAGKLQRESSVSNTEKGKEGKILLSVLSPGRYQSEVLGPLFSRIYPRIQKIFRYSRSLQGHPPTNAGDILYTIQPDSRITTSVLVETTGTGQVFRDIIPDAGTKSQGNGEPVNVVLKDAGLQQLVIPFTKVDKCEEWLGMALSKDTQVYLMEVRRYVLGVFLNATQPRDTGYEVKAREVLTGYRQFAGPVGKGTTLRRGDILVRRNRGADVTDLTKSVFIVRFMQESTSKGLGGSLPVVRGFWLGERNPVATEDFEHISDEFCLIDIDGEDKYDRIIRNLVVATQDSAQPSYFSRSGPRYEPVIRMEFNGMEIDYHPSDRRFRVTFGWEEGLSLSIEEAGYPSDSTVVKEGNRDRAARVQSRPIASAHANSRRGFFRRA